MYSEKIILQNLDEFAAREGWAPVYHSLQEVEEFKAYMNKIVKIESNSKNSYIKEIANVTAARKKEIRRWIENENVLCGLDCGYWEKNYAWVCDEKGQIFKFQPRLSQQVYNAVVADFDAKQVSIELLCIKGRQLGITTQTALKFLHRMLFLPHTQAIMASVKAESSQLIGRIIDTAYNHCPFWLVPLRMPRRAFSNGSILSIQSGMQATGLAQGWTPSAVHLCLTPNTLIRVGDGMLKPISKVLPGDTIITKEGELAKVKYMVPSPRTNEMSREIWLWGNFAPLGCTLDHPIFTSEGWKRAEDLHDGDHVRHPVRPITRTIERFRGTHEMRSKRADRGQRFWVNLNPAWGYICGLYLAEGSIRGTTRFKTEKARSSGIIFSIHEKEMEQVKKKIREAFGEQQYIGEYVKKGSFSAKLTVDVAHLARWILNHFGCKDEKRIPDWVWSAGREFCLQLVKGYLDGDGHYVPDKNEIMASSIRVQLPVQFRDLIASLGFGWSSIQYKSAGVYYERNCREQWTLIMNGECGRSFRKHFGLPYNPCDDPNYWKYDLLKENIDIQVETVADGFSNTFYDIEVDHPSHSFLTVQCAVKNSEIGDIPDPQKTIEEGLFRAAHSSKNLYMVLEGTGSGNTGWLADTWRTSKEDWPKGKSRLFPMFISWPMCPEIYPQPDWIRKFPVENSWRPKEATRKHIARCESYIRNTPYLSRVAGANYRMPIAQQWFWEFNYDTACKNHTQKTWMQQMPSDDFEALTGKHDPIFDMEVIQEVEEDVYNIITVPETGQDIKERKRPLQAYAIQGDSIDDAFILDNDDPRIDWDKPVIPVSFKNHRGESYHWELVPLLSINEDVETETFDKLLVYEPPIAGADYSCGVDTADGLDQPDEERACASIDRNMYGKEGDRQCAELTSKRMNPAQMTPFVACIAAWYGEKTKDWRGVKFAIEQIRGPGDTCQNQLKIMGFNFHHKPKRYDSKKVKDESRSKEGFYSNTWSVPILMNTFVEAVNGGWYKPASKWLIEELKTLERHTTSGRSKMEHRAGQFDDRVRAAATSFFTFHDLDDLALRSQRKYALPQKKKADPEAGKCRANAVSVGGW